MLVLEDFGRLSRRSAIITMSQILGKLVVMIRGGWNFKQILYSGGLLY
jgi:hypothetical protein